MFLTQEQASMSLPAQSLRNWQLSLTLSRRSTLRNKPPFLKEVQTSPRRVTCREKTGSFPTSRYQEILPSWSGSFSANWAALAGPTEPCSNHRSVNRINDCCFEQPLLTVICDAAVNNQMMVLTNLLSYQVTRAVLHKCTGPRLNQAFSLMFVLHSMKLKQSLSKQTVFKWLSHWLGSQGLIFLSNLIFIKQNCFC